MDDLEVCSDGYPLRGAKGGVVVDPKSLSADEKERLTRRFMQEIRGVIGPTKDIPAPDMGTDPQTMAWLMDAYSMQEGETIPGVVTGKPPAIGGSKGRERAPDEASLSSPAKPVSTSTTRSRKPPSPSRDSAASAPTQPACSTSGGGCRRG